MDKQAGLQDLALASLLGAGAGGALGLGYGAYEGGDHMALRGLEGAGLGTVAGLGGGGLRRLATRAGRAGQKAAPAAESALEAMQRNALGEAERVGSNRAKQELGRMRQKIQDTQNRMAQGGGQGELKKRFQRVMTNTSPYGTRPNMGSTARTTPPAQAKMRSATHSRQKAQRGKHAEAYESGVKFALAQCGLEKLAELLF